MGRAAGSADALPPTAVVPATCTSMRSGTAIFYIGLFGNDYGSENAGVVSPAGREFDLAAAEGKYRLIYVRGRDDAARHPKMRALVGRAQGGSDPEAC